MPLLPHSLGMLLLTMSDRFIINHKLGVADVGIYMVALQLSSALAVIFDAINKAFVPWLFDRLKSDCFIERLKIVKMTYCYMLSLLFIALLAFFIAPYIVVMIAGDKYTEAGRIIGWVCLGQIFSGMYLMVTNYIFMPKDAVPVADDNDLWRARCGSIICWGNLFLFAWGCNSFCISEVYPFRIYVLYV
ncbi:oligosaccharide flippase family protein [Edwardsiella anguillarum]|nr:oligosaccharide flippase family protein [Edwardsiella anguillarum]